MQAFISQCRSLRPVNSWQPSKLGMGIGVIPRAHNPSRCCHSSSFRSSFALSSISSPIFNHLFIFSTAFPFSSARFDVAATCNLRWCRLRQQPRKEPCLWRLERPEYRRTRTRNHSFQMCLRLLLFHCFSGSKPNKYQPCT